MPLRSKKPSNNTPTTKKMKTTNSVHGKTAVATKLRKLTPKDPNGRSIPVTTKRSSNLGAAAHARLPRHAATQLPATTPDAFEGEPSASSSTTKYFGLFRRRVRGIIFRDQHDSTSTTESLPQISPIEPYLYMCPDTLDRYYKPLPSIVRVLTVCLATSIAFLSTNWKKRLPGFSPFLFRQIAVVLFKSTAYTLIAQVVLQDTLFASKRPSRVTMKTLVQKYFLPSSLSKYEPITVEPPLLAPESNATIEPFALGVHYLQYENVEETDNETSEDPTSNPKRSFSAIYFQHGFGASSLSWLPALPKLAKQMNARVALGHDTVGFGFTDRPKDGRWYRPKQSAKIAEAILARESQAIASTLESSDKKAKNARVAPVCLFGHSMGSRATLRLATQLPAEIPKLIVLSSPALGLIAPKAPKAPPSSILAKTITSLTTAISRRAINPAFKYVLRRIIGTNGSWKKGLEGAWGDPKKVTDGSDVLRYSWPSVGYGWEEGILKFGGAQVLPADDEMDDDFLLMRRVLKLPHTKVLIILGSKDIVIPTRSVERFMEKVVLLDDNINKTDVPILELEGLGHCAFEEDREVFCDAVEQLVRENWDTHSY